MPFKKKNNNLYLKKQNKQTQTSKDQYVSHYPSDPDSVRYILKHIMTAIKHIPKVCSKDVISIGHVFSKVTTQITNW